MILGAVLRCTLFGMCKPSPAPPLAHVSLQNRFLLVSALSFWEARHGDGTNPQMTLGKRLMSHCSPRLQESQRSRVRFSLFDSPPVPQQELKRLLEYLVLLLR